MSKRRTRLFKRQPPSLEELRRFHEAYLDIADRVAEADARAWGAVAEVMSRVEPFEDEPED